MFINGSGKLIHRAAGFHDADQILALGDIALNSDKSISSMADRFAKGDRDPAFLREYTHARFEAQDGSHTQIAEAFMETQKDWLTEENKIFIFNYTDNAHSPLFDFILKNRSAFSDVFPIKSAEIKIQKVFFIVRVFFEAMKLP